MRFVCRTGIGGKSSGDLECEVSGELSYIVFFMTFGCEIDTYYVF